MFISNADWPILLRSFLTKLGKLKNKRTCLTRHKKPVNRLAFYALSEVFTLTDKRDVTL